jgi:integrase
MSKQGSDQLTTLLRRNTHSPLSLDDTQLNSSVPKALTLNNSIRRLKTPNSERTLPLIGYAKIAMEQALKDCDEKHLFPRYVRAGRCKADYASAALGKWLKKDFNGLTAHCLRHTFRDRLRAVECPLELIDQIGGWSSVGTVGSKYGQGYDLNAVREQLEETGLY